MHISHNISLAPYTTFHIGGNAEFFTTVTSKEELREAVLWARTRGCVWRVIGGGSNVLFHDSIVHGLTIKNAITGIRAESEGDTVAVHAGSGTLFDDVVAYACAADWWGLENLSHIPGTVGATPVQNVGAYGVEVAQYISSVSVYDAARDAFVELMPVECSFGYRHSLFKETAGKQYVIHEVSFRLMQNGTPSIGYKDLTTFFSDVVGAITPARIRDAVIAIRSKKFPDWHTIGTAGSFFKNPTVRTELFTQLQQQYPDIVGHETSPGAVKVSLAWILDHVCGVRGLREGNVGTYEAQALVLINHGNATAYEVMAFAKKIQECVKEKTTIEIECEVTYIDT